MIMNYHIKIVSVLIVIILIILIMINSKNKLFVPQNMIVKSSAIEKSKAEEIISCQLDCTMNDGVFHQECVGYNGCTNSSFLKNKFYCEKDSDCVINLGCCYEICQDKECLNLNYCDISNKEYIAAHSFSCENNIVCQSTKKCKKFLNSSCLNNICRIAS